MRLFNGILLNFWGTTAICKQMETVTMVCVFLVMFGTAQTNAYSKEEIYKKGDNAIVFIKNISADGWNSLDIYFTALTQKLQDIHIIIIAPNTNKKNHIEVSRKYSGRIIDINMKNGSLKFLLLNVNYMDSGNYTVFDGRIEKGKCSILVTRLILNGQVSKPMTLPFLCNNTNTSSIKIGKNHDFDYVDYIIFDVARKDCTYTKVSQDYKDRNFSCVLHDAKFELTFRELIWSDNGAYIARDDLGILLDALYVGIA
ncbi:hypothetical protein ACJMK2_024870, partial [Sinanodonta woodiana]